MKKNQEGNKGSLRAMAAVAILVSLVIMTWHLIGHA